MIAAITWASCRMSPCPPTTAITELTVAGADHAHVASGPSHGGHGRHGGHGGAARRSRRDDHASDTSSLGHSDHVGHHGMAVTEVPVRRRRSSHARS
jgi:hypothetical protein